MGTPIGSLVRFSAGVAENALVDSILGARAYSQQALEELLDHRPEVRARAIGTQRLAQHHFDRANRHLEQARAGDGYRRASMTVGAEEEVLARTPNRKINTVLPSALARYTTLFALISRHFTINVPESRPGDTIIFGAGDDRASVCGSVEDLERLWRQREQGIAEATSAGLQNHTFVLRAIKAFDALVADNFANVAENYLLSARSFAYRGEEISRYAETNRLELQAFSELTGMPFISRAAFAEFLAVSHPHPTDTYTEHFPGPFRYFGPGEVGTNVYVGERDNVHVSLFYRRSGSPVFTIHVRQGFDLPTLTVNGQQLEFVQEGQAVEGKTRYRLNLSDEDLMRLLKRDGTDAVVIGTKIGRFEFEWKVR